MCIRDRHEGSAAAANHDNDVDVGASPTGSGRVGSEEEQPLLVISPTGVATTEGGEDTTNRVVNAPHQPSTADTREIHSSPNSARLAASASPSSPPPPPSHNANSEEDEEGTSAYHLAHIFGPRALQRFGYLSWAIPLDPIYDDNKDRIKWRRVIAETVIDKIKSLESE
eukprot:TRINITY_DN62514_c0_g1_i1.p1 TRINITY_DN62514_c0_g1~~TRINITY_DN62514_c0_g1_i1.p1  ORF type:complete len:169 (+),score=38.50 TRINITY_DN62514_c0_g1_i1:148-654(+)